ncbi:MAG: glycosyltransferase [Anaeroplasmataceae bacterium]|nr:glycosyltransferase [Anaeroplasmataceae bacterium]MDE6413805.1 glycosyltransferase [Anaeroplasmataceae bacterium]
MIVLTGGKTGGHIMPLLALSKKLSDVCYVGAYNSLEERLCQKHQIHFYGMNLKNNHIPGIIKCFLKLKLKNVTAIISTGGYVSFPVLLYGIFHRIPIYLLEENVILGKTNRFFGRFAKKVFLTYPLEDMKKKYRVTGLPTLTQNLSYQKYLSQATDILIIGGSLGSKPLCDLAKQLNHKYTVSLIAGRYFEEYKDLENVKVYDYIHDLPSFMLQTRLIISRAGASTTYEIFSIGKPCIIVPSLNTSQNHQYLNAVYFEEQGCCKLLKEKDLDTDIASVVELLLNDGKRMQMMMDHQRNLVVKNSCEKIIEEIGI